MSATRPTLREVDVQALDTACLESPIGAPRLARPDRPQRNEFLGDRHPQRYGRLFAGL